MPEGRTAYPSPIQQTWLLGTVITTLAPHVQHLPTWLAVLCAGLLGLRILLLFRRGKTVPQTLIVAAAVAAGVGVKIHFGHFFGKDPGVALLAVLLCLKLLETRNTRDIRSAVLLSFFLQLGLFFYNQTLVVAAFALTGALLATTTLLGLQDENTRPAAQLRTGALLLAQGFPFMLVLFVLFPRVQGPLWGLPADAYSGMSGLSESMTPGSISQLGLSDAIAFRADFNGPPPPPAQRYWRGPVLTFFDGRTWRPGPFTIAAEPDYAPAGPVYDYRLTLEPHNQNWLLALDFPGPGVPGAHYASDFRLLANQPVRERARFELRAYPAITIGADEDPEVLATARRIPATFNPRSRALAQDLARDASSHDIILARTLEHLRRSELTYTLSPPLLGTHAVDEFLFDIRRGFCEHFAATFVFLMRAAGVPARVVTGYLGGEVNPIDRSLVVRQSDAHAWAEVWLDRRGWVRIDPTALAAPERIESGLAAALPAWENLPLMMRPGLTWLRDLRHRWEALSNTWNQWVLGYNPDRQRELLERIGFARPDWRTLGVLLGASAGALMLLLFAWAFVHHQRRDPLDRAWAAFCRKLARHGAARHPWEGPVDYGKRLAIAFPRHAASLHDIASRYARLRYGPSTDERDVRELARFIRRLNLK
jgi:transglutaminase-like putative cysteine protease